MIISPSRLEDMRERAYYLKTMEECLRDNLVITARKCGEHAKWLGERIKNHDYSREDAWLEKERNLKTNSLVENL